MTAGRPTKYNMQIANEICDAISSSELGLIHLVNAHEHWPDRSTIFLWRRTHPEFSDMYTKAKEEQCEVVVEYMQEVMSEPHHYMTEDGSYRVDVPMLRLKMDTMKWHAAKLKPKKFGDMKQLETVNTDISDDCKKRYQDLDERNKKEY
jgi:hypothetical protein